MYVFFAQYIKSSAFGEFWAITDPVRNRLCIVPPCRFTGILVRGFLACSVGS